jgi:SulP family sulfate permease
VGRLLGTVTRYLPGIAVLAGYRRRWLRPDLLAGLTVGAMLVPQCMAYAELAGLPPEAGFRAALLAIVVYALVGSSRHLGVGPEPGTAIIAATGVAPLAAGSPERYAALMAALALVVCAVCVVAAAARLGFVAALLSKPVLVGYLTGVGLTLVTSQLARFTGVPVAADTPFARVREFVTHLDAASLATLAVAVATLAVILACRRWLPRAPGALLAVGAATAAGAVFSLDEHGVATVGTIPAGLPSLALPDVPAGDWVSLLPVALGITVVGYADNILTARSISRRMGYRIDDNREFLALGAVNAAAGLSQGFPVSSSASRSAVPAMLGSATQLVGLVAAGSVAASLLFLRGVLAQVPQAAIAAVIVAAAVAIIDLPGFRGLWRLSRTECGLAVATALGVLVFDVLVGVALAVGLSVAVAVYHVARPHDAVLGAGRDLNGWVDVDTGGEPLPGLLVYRFDAPLFFANATRFGQRLRELLEANPGREEWVVLDCEGIGSVDATAVDELEELVADLAAGGVGTIAVARANEVVLGMLGRAGLLGPTGPVTVYPTINAAVRAFEERTPGP